MIDCGSSSSGGRAPLQQQHQQRRTEIAPGASASDNQLAYRLVRPVIGANAEDNPICPDEEDDKGYAKTRTCRALCTSPVTPPWHHAELAVGTQ